MARNRLFRFLTWNVRGLNDHAKCAIVKSFVRSCKCSVICLQEMKLSSTPLAKFWAFCGFHLRDYRTLDAIGTRGGLLTTWNPFLFDCIQHWNGSFSLNVVLKRKVDGKVFYVTNVYGPTRVDLKPAFFQELREICGRSVGAWAVLGDFNTLLSLSDKNGMPSNSAEILLFREAINDTGLADLPLRNRAYTWSNGRRNPTLERLDRALVSLDWLRLFPSSSLKALPRQRSDHCPLILTASTFVPHSGLFSV
uniref:Endonuclease/exonuclease/phosphatase domain-containing protein n=1 Tax=Ananas comosus var. bracteatus TaxID=296719 RepID=A0A6V7PUY4_ANACO|nr:unnamed protein product [Ananas comosus var. bracteatus]